MTDTTEKTRGEVGPLFRMALDFGPILVFFIVNAVAKGHILIATAAFMVATAVSMIASRIVTGRVSPMLWMTGALVFVFGGLTLYFGDKQFIQMKPTVIYAMFAAILAFGLSTGRPLLKSLLGSAYPGLDETGWRKLTINWTGFFVVMAVVNEVVRHNSSFDFWVAFKLWGVLPATLLFAGANIPMLMKHGLTAEPLEAEAAAAPPPQ